MQKIKVLLADDHPLVRQGLRALLKPEPDVDVVADAETGSKAITLARTLRPDVVVMDIAMPFSNGIENTRRIVNEHPTTKVLILSAYADEAYILQAYEAGASGYVHKQTVTTELVGAIRDACTGSTFLCPAFSKGLLQRHRNLFQGGKPSDVKSKALSSREAEVLRLVAAGLANKKIAEELSVTVDTVDKHRQHVMKKLHIHDIARLTRYAISMGMVSGADPTRIGEE